MPQVVKFFSSHKERVNGLQFFVSLYKDSSRSFRALPAATTRFGKPALHTVEAKF